jgi:O-Antigen ligase
MLCMADAVAIGPDASAMGDVPVTDDAPDTRARKLAVTALMLLPGALIVLMGFNAGGYFPAVPAVGALLVTQVLLVRIVQSRHPFEGLARSTLVAIAALAGYAALTLLSQRWSHSPGRALIEFDRAWLYLAILVLFATVRASRDNLRWLIRGLLLGISIVCLAGLISRVLPDVLHTAPDVSNQRLSYPVTYWNTLGLLAALGMVFAFHLTCTLGERRFVQLLAAAVVPLLAATLFFTFSRGAIAAGAIGLGVYVLAGRPRALLSGALATVPATAVLIVVAYHANLLDTVRPTTPAAISQGHHVALVAGVCAAVCAGLRAIFAIGLDPHLRRIAGRALMSRHTRLAVIAGAIATVLVVVVALGVPHSIANDWNRFMSGAATHGGGGDLRLRLTDPSNDGRTDLWRVALHGFSLSPLHGYGAGMYNAIWDQRRPLPIHTLNAHSLYLQAMAELGIPGIALLVALVGTALVGLGMRARGPRRSLVGALLAAAVVWALRAGVDWDWEMPVVCIGFFAAAGLALSPRRDAPPGWIPSARTRIVLGLLCLATAVPPVLIIGSQRHLDDAEYALQESNCTEARSAALSSIAWLDVRAQPYEIVGFCDVGRGLPRPGVSAMRQAVRLDPGSWETHYLLALAQASAGIDPRGAAQVALSMNPHDHLAQEAVSEFRTSSPIKWIRRAAILRAATLELNDLSIFPS